MFMRCKEVWGGGSMGMQLENLIFATYVAIAIHKTAACSYVNGYLLVATTDGTLPTTKVDY